MKKRLCALLLIGCMALSILMVPAAATGLLISPKPAESGMLLPRVRTYEGQLTDASDAWCTDAIQTVYETGLMEGKTTSRFDYTSPLTEAQSVVIAARVYARLIGKEIPAPAEGERWYQPSYDLLSSLSKSVSPEIARLLVTESFIEDAHHQDAWRDNFIGSLLVALHGAGTELPVLNQLETRPPDLAADSPELLLYRAGILNGTDQYGSFDATGTLTRGQAAAILARLADPAQRLTFTLTSFDLCTDALKVPPETVLFTVDNHALTAREAAYTMALGITTHSRLWDSSMNWSETYMLNTLCEYYALETMANERNTELSPETEALLDTQALRLAGTGGASREGHLFWQRYNALYSAVKRSYDGTDNAHGVSEPFDQALKQYAAEISLEPTATYQALDLAAFRQVLLNSGFYFMTMEPLYR